jgi:hypothetical protein
MLNEIRNNPVMLMVFVVAIANLLIGDTTQTQAILETGLLVAGGLVARAKVTPNRKVRQNAASGQE